MRPLEKDDGPIRAAGAVSSALVVGALHDQEREQLTRAAARAGVSLLFCPSVTTGLSRLRSGQGTLGVVVAQHVELQRFVDSVRDEAELFSVPIMAYVPRPSPEGFRDAYRAGADDVLIASDHGGLTRRMANLERVSQATMPAVTQGVAVVASPHEAARKRLGRTLRQVGFDVAFAASLDEIATFSKNGETPLFGVATGVPPEGLGPSTQQVGEVVRMGEVPVLFLAWDDKHGLHHSGEEIVDATGRLLFFADERSKARFKDRRASARRLFSTVCSFREAGSMLPTFAATYNVSREGLYVRTLDPPRPDSMLWVELQSPTTAQPVHLRARAVWQRLPGASFGILPPGFGLRIDADQCPPGDMEAYLVGYEQLPD